MAIIPGKVWHNTAKKGLYFIFVDLDNQKAIDEFCTRNGVTTPLTELAKVMIIEQHSDDPTKAHAYCYSTNPFTKKSSDRTSDLSNKLDTNDIPAIEVKGLGEHGIAYCTPSPHKNGHNYQIIGTTEPETNDELEQQIDSICKKYGIPYLGNGNGNGRSLPPIQDLFKEDTKVYEGHNRHEALLRVMDSLLKRNKDLLSLKRIKELANEWNKNHCSPPLDIQEEDNQWKAAIKFIESKSQDNENVKQTTSNSDNNGNGYRESTDSQAQTNAEIIVELAQHNAKQFFKDQYGMAFSVVRIVDHNEIIALESSRFKRFLAKLFYDNNDHRVVSTDSINNAIQILQAIAEYESPTIPLSLRVAWSKDKESIYYDLTDEKWRCVKISKGDWDIINNSPVLFVRHNQVPQVEPVREYEDDVFEQFLELTNIKDSNSGLLLKVYIITTIIPEIAHPILVLYGDKGAAKSTLQTLIKKLLDPSKPTLLTVHGDRTEFIQQLSHNFIAFYDNMKYNPAWLSDEACKAVTGVGHTKRKLYSNDDDIVYEYRRCLGFNGININLTEPDVLDRSIMIEQERIPRQNRQSEIKILSRFEELQPRLLGYIFDILSRALTIKDSIKLAELPRMADFGTWGEAIARALGYSPIEFLNAYYDNIGRQNIEAIEAQPLGQAIVKLCVDLDEQQRKEWYGSTTECLEELGLVADKYHINIDSKSWPKAPNILTRRLNQIKSNLLEGLGIEVNINRVTQSKERRNFNTSTVRIRKVSPEPPEPPASQIHEGKSPGSTGDIESAGDVIPPANKIPPAVYTENHGQNDVAGHTGDAGGIGGISLEDSSHKSLASSFKKRVTSKGVTFYHCPHCLTVETIYPEEIARHIKYSHTILTGVKNAKSEDIGTTNQTDPGL